MFMMSTLKFFKTIYYPYIPLSLSIQNLLWPNQYSSLHYQRFSLHHRLWSTSWYSLGGFYPRSCGTQGHQVHVSRRGMWRLHGDRHESPPCDRCKQNLLCQWGECILLYIISGVRTELECLVQGCPTFLNVSHNLILYGRPHFKNI